MMLYVLVVLDFNGLVALRAQFGVVCHQFVYASLAENDLTVFVVAEHRCSRKVVTVVTTKVIKEGFVHLQFPWFVSVDPGVRYKIIFISLVHLTKSVLLLRIAKMAIF